MSADIAALPSVSAAPSDGEAKAPDTAQGDDRRVAQGRTVGALGGSGEHRAANGVSGRLQIDEDDATGDFIYRIVDEKTGEVIRQWPREEQLRANRFMRAVQGALYDRKV
jgi:hypothetical protein